ncbi:hypothetical protein RRG08_055782 [Elysia crispata]|uniref:Uncharacterized protein n=1 Tax=Elysia crispata TaxID=231223 RepID=A0AAE0XS65_9GAST|nr:hypothetical protein RRG08_055782 [Elysia crispata]
MRVAAVALHLQSLGPLPVEHQSGCCSPAPTTTGAPTCTTSERLLYWSPYQYNIRAAAVALHLQPLGPDLYDIRAADAALHLQPLDPYLYDIRAAAVALHPQPLGPYLYDIRAAAVALQPQPLWPLPVEHQSGCCSPAPTTTGAPTCTTSERLLHWGSYLYDIRAAAVALHLQPLGPYLYDIRAAAVALHLQPLGPYLYDIRADALTLHLQPLGPYLYDIRAAAVALHLQPLGSYLYDIRADAVALHLQPLGLLPVRYQSGCCSPAPTATGTPTCTISERMLTAAVALHLQPPRLLPVRYQKGCCSPAPTATGAPTCTIAAVALHLQPLGPYLYDIRAAAVALHLQPLGPYLYDIREAAVALHLQPLGLLPVRYQSGCCSPAPTATGAPTCTISERMLHWGPYLYDMRAAAVALHLQPLEPLPIQYQSGCCSPAPTATGTPTCTISERML